MSEVPESAVASGSAGPHVPAQRSSGSNEPGESQGPERAVQVSELLDGLKEKIIEIELWIRNMVRDGTVFEIQQGDRSRVGVDFRIEGGFIQGAFKLNWNEILSTEQRGEVSYTFGTGADDWWRKTIGNRQTEITTLQENQNGQIDQETRAELHAVHSHDGERSTQWE